ncbi:MAG: aminoacyl-histidine dipeptidase [Acidobacteria bacterium]|nr:aminoacyl-histidine dipeptidase [Acidobacteriota bacterium]
MAYDLENLEPRGLWKQFKALSAIPRGSKNEEAAALYVLAEARRLGLEAKRDAIGNVVVYKKATPGMEDAVPCVLQGHLDMVCEKNEGTVHDFTRDGIQLVVDGDFLRARGTTLGADNGIGVAAGLAVMEATDIPHGPLEFLFTIDEETGLTGAFNLDGSLVKGRRLLNMDSEEEGALYVGCAGGLDSNVTFTFTPVKPAAWKAPFRLKVSGLKGGHSGLNIPDGLGNAIKCLARALADFRKPFGMKVATLEGGSKRNAIPREAFAVFYMDAFRREEFEAALARLQADLRSEIGKADPGLTLTLEALDQGPEYAIPGADVERVVNYLVAARHGVVSFSPDIAGLVQTSSNLAIIATGNGVVSVSQNHRSSIESAKYDVAAGVSALCALAGVEVEHGNGYPGWKPDMDAALLKVAEKVHQEVFGFAPQVKAIHAGLECGIIGERCPGMEMISFGPNLHGAHSPDERVSIPSTGRFWDYLLAMLRAMKA